MQLGKSLVGAIIGAAVGIAVLVGVHMLTGWDKAWLAILVAILTGLGVRMMVATTRPRQLCARRAHRRCSPSGAFLAWYPIHGSDSRRGTLRQADRRRPSRPSKRTRPMTADEADDTADRGCEDCRGGSAAGRQTSRPLSRRTTGRTAPDAAKPRARQFSTWDYRRGSASPA